MTGPGVLLPVGDHLLVGTNARGLGLLARRGPRGADSARVTLRMFGPAQGLAASWVGALAYDRARDRLWIGGASGIDCIDHASQTLGFDPAGEIP